MQMGAAAEDDAAWVDRSVGMFWPRSIHEKLKMGLVKGLRSCFL